MAGSPDDRRACSLLLAATWETWESNDQRADALARPGCFPTPGTVVD